MSENESKYTAQKKYLSTQKQLRVWVNPEQYDALKKKAAQNQTSIYALVNSWISAYLQEPEG